MWDRLAGAGSVLRVGRTRWVGSEKVGSTGVDVFDDRPLGGGFDTGGTGTSPGSMDGAGLPSVSSRLVLIGGGSLEMSAVGSSVSRWVSGFEVGVASVLDVVSLVVVLGSVALPEVVIWLDRSE